MALSTGRPCCARPIPVYSTMYGTSPRTAPCTSHPHTWHIPAMRHIPMHGASLWHSMSPCVARDRCRAHGSGQRVLVLLQLLFK